MVFEDHAFFTHDWNIDQNGRDNHARVREVAKHCKAKGLNIWFDEDRMVGNIVDKMCDGIDNSGVVVVFVTRNYIEKVAQQARADDNCKLEFNYALRRRRPTMMIAVVMEECVRDTCDWRGGVGMALGNHLYVDMALGDVPNSAKMDELVSKIEDHLRTNNITIAANSGSAVQTSTSQITISAPPPKPVQTDAGKPHSLMSAYGNRYDGLIKSGTKASGIGEFTCQMGNEKDFRYVGPFEGQTMVGMGTMYYDDGSTYEGERSSNGKKHGKGTYVWASGNSYEGDWVDGDMTGMGTFRWKSSGDVYVGQYQSDKRKGKGKVTRSDGTYYDGMWENSNKHGEGIEKFADGLYRVKYNNDSLVSKVAIQDSAGMSHSLTSAYGNTYVGKILIGDRQSGTGDFRCSQGNEKDFRYVGPFENGRMVGIGTMYYDDGSTYEGERTSNGKKHGKGTYTWASGNSYNGDWVDGDMTGMGTYRWKSSGDVYVGQYQSDKRKGKGKLTRSDGTYYDGMWENDQKHGEGIEKFADGTLKHVKYDKDKLVTSNNAAAFVPTAPRGVSHTLMSAYGNPYVGTITHGNTSKGVGEFLCSTGNENGFRYIGPFENGRMVGVGTIIYDDGSKYEGHRAKNGKKHGKGKYTWASGNTYDGDWVEGDMTGHGTFRWTDGDVYVGQFKDDDKSGKGKLTRRDGSYYEGSWEKNKKNGEGIEKFSDGLYKVKYRDDNLVSKTKAGFFDKLFK